MSSCPHSAHKGWSIGKVTNGKVLFTRCIAVPPTCSVADRFAHVSLFFFKTGNGGSKKATVLPYIAFDQHFFCTLKSRVRMVVLPFWGNCYKSHLMNFCAKNGELFYCYSFTAIRWLVWDPSFFVSFVNSIIPRTVKHNISHWWHSTASVSADRRKGLAPGMPKAIN